MRAGDPRERTQLVVLALGGNASYPPGIRGLASEQLALMEQACRHLSGLVEDGFQLLVTHGNGPVVGNILFRMARTADELPPMPMDICVAHSQGGMGYMLQQTLANVLRERGIARPVVSLLTQVEVDPRDPAFDAPTKPVGRFFTQAEADALSRGQGWSFIEDAGRGWRRVVPSPRPLRVLEIESLATLLAAGAIAVAAGGGGIPVAADDSGRWRGVGAVVDKDLTSALLAAQLGAGTLVLVTGVDRVALDYGLPTMRAVDRLTSAQAAEHLRQGQFPPGSMGPKIDAALQYLQAGGRQVIITSIDKLQVALAGHAGTRIVP
jgi:carbamate kinase